MSSLRWLPITDWLPNYRKNWLPGDLTAGLTVGIMLIPQGMAYALLAGLPPIHGLYAATLPLILYAMLGTSRQLAVGPVAMDSMLTALGVGAIAVVGTSNYLMLAAILALLVGVIQLSAGLFRLGFLVDLLSRPVISGFTSAAALIIASSQLRHLLGVDLGKTTSFLETMTAAIGNVGKANGYTLALGIGGMLLILGLRKINRKIPAPLFVVGGAVLLAWGFGLNALGVKIVGDIPAGLPALQFQLPTMAQIGLLFPTALAIALVSFMETIGVGMAVQRRHGNYKVIPNQELIAVGASNIGNALVGGYPGAGGFSRTAVNDQAGANTQLAALISAGLIVLTLLFLTPLFYFLPQAVLASIIMVAVFGLVDVKEARRLWSLDRNDFWMLAATFMATLFLGIQLGIGIGVALSLAVHIYRGMRPHLAILGRLPGTGVYRNVNRFTELETIPGVLILRFDGPLFFANVGYFREQLATALRQREKPVSTIILNAEGISSMDSTATDSLRDLLEELSNKDTKLIMAGVIGPVRDTLFHSGITEKMGAEFFAFDVADAVALINQPLHLRPRPEHATQCNQ
ncbi:SulP family inorganic anion transporter [Neolewinella persica]|uniref:SulP family inorganic anion transporter n=1 Tax=Neolewinella persica TaxID=70998 RepID=UPI00036B473F|nr:solute carrier family 26 protein [Neolewinella persica]